MLELIVNNNKRDIDLTYVAMVQYNAAIRKRNKKAKLYSAKKGRK